MRKIVAVVMLAVALGGCAQLQTVGTGISLITKSVTNPVTENELYQIEASVSIVVKALVTYRRACIAGNADVNCRANIAAIQPYTKEVPIYLAQLRRFVRDNDQVNAATAYNTLTTLLTNAKSTAVRLGVNLGA